MEDLQRCSVHKCHEKARETNTDCGSASIGGTWAFVSSVSANLREKRDPYNDALGGFFAGMYPGLFSMFALTYLIP